MKNENYWDQFMQSGRIEDYLHFREESGRMREKKSGNVTKGENPNAGFCNRNGDGSKDGAGWGI